MSIDELIAQLKAAEEGSRELSDRVLLACGWKQQEIETAGGWPIMGWLTPDKLYWSRDIAPRPSPTENLQNALGLVPEGCAYTLQYLPMAHYPGRAWVFADACIPEADRHEPPCLGYTLALALCIAALKARDA